VNSSSDEEKEIAQLFEKARRLKEAARTSLDNIDAYLEAAMFLKRNA
jgi:hypothetical protein